MDEIGVIHGRFQCLHKGHLEYLLAGKSRCKHLIVGITNYTCDVENEEISQIDTHRLNKSANPFTYFERMEMIRNALIESNIDKSEFDIVPFPIENPESIFNFVPRNATFYITIYDKWGEEKKRILEKLNVNIDLMWRRTKSEKPISGSLVRDKILKCEDWKHLVPKSVFEYITKNNLEKKIRG